MSNKNLQQKCLDILTNAITQLSSLDSETSSNRASSPIRAWSSEPEFLLNVYEELDYSTNDPNISISKESESFQQQVHDLYKEPADIINGIVATMPLPQTESNNSPSSNNIEMSSPPTNDNLHLNGGTFEDNLAHQFEQTTHSRDENMNKTCSQDSNVLDNPSIDDVKNYGMVLRKPPGRGRPQKAAVSTVVGTRKKNLTITPFVKLDPGQKRREMLLWFVMPLAAVKNTMEGSYKIESKYLSVICDAFLDPNVKIDILKDDFNPETFKKFKSKLNNKKSAIKNGKKFFSCAECEQKLSEKSVCCQLCLLKYDYHCVGLEKNLRRHTLWYCETCKEKFNC